jgi:DNA-binding response OmpR family regulator
LEVERAVLLVDEDPQLYAALARVLTHGGYIVCGTFSARQALNRLRDQPFDLLILDLQLTDTSGLCLLSMVRRLYPYLPVLVLTADDSLENILKALRLGARGYLAKTVVPEQVRYCVDEILKEAPEGLAALARFEKKRSRPKQARSRRNRSPEDPEEYLV